MGQHVTAVAERHAVLQFAPDARAKSEQLPDEARRLGLKSTTLRYRVGRLVRWYCGEV